MSEGLELTADEPKLDTAGKRALIEKELRENPQRSDRAIAQAVGHGICHKTVAAARERLGINSPPLSPGASQGVTNHHGATLSPELFPILNAPKKPERFNPFDPRGEDKDCLIAAERLGLAVFVNTRENVVICNGNIRDGIDEMVQISPSDLHALIRHLGEVLSEIRDAEKEDGSNG
jgi:hypothetical protein